MALLVLDGGRSCHLLSLILDKQLANNDRKVNVESKRVPMLWTSEYETNWSSWRV